MTNKTTIPSLQDIHRKRQQSDFTGRAQQVADFRANLCCDVTDAKNYQRKSEYPVNPVHPV